MNSVNLIDRLDRSAMLRRMACMSFLRLRVVMRKGDKRKERIKQDINRFV